MPKLVREVVRPTTGVSMLRNSVLLGDCLKVLPTFPADSVDAVCTDPPYGLRFMNHEWDNLSQGWHRSWAEAVLRALRPSGYMVCFGGSRTFHRLACAVEDAGFKYCDTIMFLHAMGFPKGRGRLKPAFEPIMLCRKPGPKVKPLGIDECRVGVEKVKTIAKSNKDSFGVRMGAKGFKGCPESVHSGRWPANVIHDGSEEVMKAFERFAAGTAARFFFCAKADSHERDGGVNSHPTVKPLSLMKWLIKLVCPAGGICLDPFLGSGTTAIACMRAGRDYVGIEREQDYIDIVNRRIRAVNGIFSDQEAPPPQNIRSSK